MQGEIPIDLSTVNGLRERYLRDTGKIPSKKMDATFKRAAKRVTQVLAEDDAAMQNLGKEIERVTRGRKLPSADEVRNRVLERMKVDPCRI